MGVIIWHEFQGSILIGQYELILEMWHECLKVHFTGKFRTHSSDMILPLPKCRPLLIKLLISGEYSNEQQSLVLYIV